MNEGLQTPEEQESGRDGQPTHIAENEDGAMTAVFLLFKVYKKKKEYTIKIQRDMTIRHKELYRVELATAAAGGMSGPDGQTIISTYEMPEGFDEWTEAIGAGIQQIEALSD